MLCVCSQRTRIIIQLLTVLPRGYFDVNERINAHLRVFGVIDSILGPFNQKSNQDGPVTGETPLNNHL